MRAYLDNAATTRIHPSVREAMELALSAFGNPSSLHTAGREARELLEEARRSVAEELAVAPETIVFTSGATEADNLAVLGTARAATDRGRHLVTCTIEHAAVRGPVSQLRREGFEVTEVPVDAAGRVDPDDVAASVRPDTVLVSIMLANNEIGTVQRIAEIRERIGDVPLHTDAAQASGKLRLHVPDLGVDLLTLSGHKMHGPRGVGILHRAPSVPLEPLTHGGSHEHGLRPGTENVVVAVGFARALSLAHRELAHNVAHMERLRRQLRQALESELPEAVFHGSETERLPTIINFSLPGTEGEAAVLVLDAEGIAVSAGSACEALSVEPSHVIRGLGVSDPLARASVRLSVAADTTDAEVEEAVRRIPRALRRLTQG